MLDAPSEPLPLADSMSCLSWCRVWSMLGLAPQSPILEPLLEISDERDLRLDEVVGITDVRVNVRIAQVLGGEGNVRVVIQLGDGPVRVGLNLVCYAPIASQGLVDLGAERGKHVSGLAVQAVDCGALHSERKLHVVDVPLENDQGLLRYDGLVGSCLETSLPPWLRWGGVGSHGWITV